MDERVSVTRNETGFCVTNPGNGFVWLDEQSAATVRDQLAPTRDALITELHAGVQALRDFDPIMQPSVVRWDAQDRLLIAIAGALERLLSNG